MTQYLQEDTMNQTVTEEDVFTFPASHAQRRLWLVDQLEPGNPAYNVPNLILLKGQLNIEALAAAVEEIIWRHESLRTTFEAIDGELMQVIAADVHHTMPIVDVTGLPRHEREREAHRLATEEARSSFDLKRGPLITTTLYRLRDEEHWLMLNLHHVITDGWSMGILFRELAELYHAFSSDKPSQLAELSLQYADYANWQSEWLQGEVMQEQMSYWKQQLGGRLPVLQLPSDRPRKAVQTFNGRTDVFTYPQELRQSLLEVSRTEGATLFMTLLAAFNTLLHRWTGQDDICVGSPIAGRTSTELKEIVGCFVNTLVMRTDLSGQPTFRDLLTRTKQVALDAYANQDMPLEMLIEALQPERNLSHPPLFQVMFVLQNAPMELLELPGLTMSHKETDNAAAHFDLFFSIKETAQGLYIKVNYNTDLFDPSTIERLMGHYGNLLQAIVENPDLAISKMPLVGEQEQRLLAEWSQGGSLANEEQSNALIHQLFEAQAVRTPDGIALAFEGRSLTYRELNQRANQLAHHLQKKGIGAESIVGLCLERSLEMVIALLGVLKSGGAYLPLDPKAPLERQRFVLEETDSRVLLTQARFEKQLAVEGLEVIALDEADLSGESGENPVSNATADSLAYVIYTSGSTGKPKGVLVPHRGVCNRLLWGQEHDPLTAGDSVLQKTPYTFDVSVWEFFWPLLAGARLVLAKPEGHQDPSYLVDLITKEGITTAHFVPSMLALFLQEKGLERITSLRRVICSGEALSYELQERFFSRIGATLHNYYGPTETSIEVTYWDCQPESTRRTVPIGHPIAGVEAYVLDRHLRPVPIGVAGELYLGGACVTRGYLKRPELTEAVFVPHPFRADERVYKTGDLVRVLTDGAIEYLGRLDHQVKIRGFRIELGEIETALLADAAIREAVVLAREDVPGDKRLVAYLVASGTGNVPTVTELRTRLKESLPEYMVPSVFFFLDEMPLTSSGKADRKALPVPDALRPELAAEYVEARNELEATVVELWTELLDVERVGVLDNFFDLGGHSLKATQLTAAISSRFGVELPLIKLFEEPTVAGLCRMIEAAQNKSDRVDGISGNEGTQESPIRSVGKANGQPNQTGAFTFPASHAQRRLWLFDQLEPGSAAYNVPNLIRLQGRLDIETLEASLREIILRHESLRTTFDVINGELMQVIAADVQYALPIIDLTELPRHEREREAHRLANEVAGSSFDLKHGPLITTTLYRLREEEHWLMLNLHHTITDGWSMGILFRELAELYQARSTDKPSPLSELNVQYADYAHWQNEWLQGEAIGEQMAYWQDQLGGGLPVLQLPTDRPRQAVQTYNGRTDVFVYSQELRQSLLEISRQEGATLFMTLLAAFNTLLHRRTGQEDICVGSPIAGRTRTEVKEIVGCFINTLVMRTDLSGQPTFRDLLTRTKKVALDAYAHQDVPVEMLVETLQPERNLSHSPLFQVLFVLQNAPLDVLELPELTMSYKETDSAASHFDLSFSIKETAQGLYVSVNYNTDLFDASTIERLMGHYGNLLAAVAEDMERPLSRLPMLDDAERAQVLTVFNDTQQSHPADVRLHELFEAQAARTPESVAVEFEGDALTYDELNKRANRLASRLVLLGVGRGSRVGLHLERSLDLAVSLLAVLKTGGAYVPLDPTYPAERLTYMAEDAELTVLLSQSHLERTWETATHVLFLDHESEDGSDENLLVEGTEEDPCYVLYTSGSTGTPKGVVIPHRALCNHMFWMQERFPLNEQDAVLQKTSFSFDASVWEFYAPLLVGARLVLAHPEGHLDPGYLVQAIEDKQITILQVVPSVLHLVLDAVKPNGCNALKRVFCGGEALTKELQERFHATLPAELVNLYGPTEACIDATYHVCVRGDERNIIPIGQPIDNMQAYVLDADLQPVPLGVPGELFLGGRGVALGYWKRAELTEERFVANPFGDGTLYRTGDLARWLESGELEYLGRIDHQVKLRGYRVELGEIEAALVELEEVREAAVLVRNSQLIAYIVPENENLGSSDVCRANLSARLPEYMVPARFVVLEQMPLTPNGKLNRQALPDPDPSTAVEQTYTAPRNEIEQRLVTIWSQLLGRENIGVYDSFFALGGHSLLAMQLLMRVREAFGVEVPLRSVFANPTVAELAVLVGSASSVVEADVIVPVPRTDEMPLSFAQQRLLFFDRFQPNSATYNIPYAVRITGQVEGNLMERCVQEVVRRHEVLRTTFTFTEKGPMQRVHESVEVPLRQVDLRASAVEGRKAAALRIAREEAGQPFDLAQGPLLRAVWVQLEETDSLLILAMHHIVSDGWSLDVLLHELTTLYTAFSQGKPSPLAELPVQYADYASWQQERLQGNLLTEQLAYWKEQLGGTLPLLELPTDHPRPALPSYRGDVRSTVLPQELLRGLQRLGSDEQSTLYMTLLTAYQVLLHRYTGQDDLLIGSPVAGRHRAEVEALIGFFVNTLVLRGDLSGNPTFREALRRVRETALGAFAHQDVPFERLVEELQPERHISRTPLIQTMFVLQNTPQRREGLNGMSLQLMPVDNGTAKFDLSLVMLETEDGLMASVEYSTDLFDDITIERMLTNFGILLQAIVDNPDQSLSDLALLSDQERHLLLEEWKGTTTDYPRDQTLRELFESQVNETPDAWAVCFRDDRLTYRELNERAERLAGFLRAQGVTAGATVAVSSEPSAAMVVGLIAIIKAGGAYVPLDPAHPQDRLTFMLEDSRAALLLVDGTTVGRFAGQTVPAIRLDEEIPSAVERGVQGASSVEQEAVIQADEDTALIESVVYGKQSSITEVAATATVTSATDAASVIYTSGSTGNPKGVAVPHRGIVRLVRNTNCFELEPHHRIAQACNTSFDPFALELWGALLNGAELVGIGRDLLFAPQRLKQELREQNISLLVLPTALFHQVAQEAPDAFATLRYLIVGGEAIDPRRVREVMASGAPAEFLNIYGPTENATSSTFYRVEGLPDAERPIPIGIPVSNSEVYVLDTHLQPVPIGVLGELYLGGDGLALGYLHREDLTAERFIEHPFQAGQRLYKTGDRVRYRADRVLEFHGRLDQQIKYRGYRIEPGEIETILTRHPAITQAFVTVLQDESAGKRLVAYLVTTGAAPETADLQRFLTPHLPDYMVPTVYLFLESLPLTANGKVDARALPMPDTMQVSTSRAHLPARDETEQRLVAIWEELLGVTPIGVTDSFFGLGGHSLLAMQVLSRVQAEFGRELPVAMFFQEATIAHLATLLRNTDSPCGAEQPAIRKSANPIPIQPHGSRTPLFLVHPVGGTVFCYSRLAQILDLDQPLYGLQSRGVDQGETPLSSLEEMAAEYIEAIRTVQPAGPYRLGGWSLGGVIAGEMAHQLQQAGEQVEHLFLIDSFVPVPEQAADDRDLTLMFVSDLLSGFGQPVPDFDPQVLAGLTAEEMLTILLEGTRELGLLTGNGTSDNETLFHLHRVFLANTTAFLNHTPAPYSGKATLYRAADQPVSDSVQDGANGWKALIKQLSVHELPGDHFALLTREVEALATHIRTQLDTP